MAQFLLTCLDKPGALEIRLANRPAHIDWLKSHGDKVLMAGPLLGEDGESMIGSVLIIEAESLEALQAWQAADPYAAAGLFYETSARPMKWALGKGPQA
jgi:uncharacterized protein YciI